MNIREISKEGRKLSITKNNEWFMGMIGDTVVDVESIKDDLHSTIDVHLREDKSVIVEGDVHADVVMRCVKCLESFPTMVDRQFSVSIEPYEQSVSTNRNISSSDLDAEFYTNDEFDPDTVVFEQIMISLPIYPLCKPDCKGLCEHCGINLNEHPGHRCDTNRSDDNPFRKQIEKIKKTL